MERRSLTFSSLCSSLAEIRIPGGFQTDTQLLRNQSSTREDEQGAGGRKPPRRPEISPTVDVKLTHADRSCSSPGTSWCAAGARPRGASSGLCPPPAGFPGDAKACTRGWLES